MWHGKTGVGERLHAFASRISILLCQRSSDVWLSRLEGGEGFWGDVSLCLWGKLEGLAMLEICGVDWNILEEAVMGNLEVDIFLCVALFSRQDVLRCCRLTCLTTTSLCCAYSEAGRR